MTTHPHPEMIDPRQWCSACGIHVASEATPQSPALALLCPACADDPDQRLYNEAASMLHELHEIEQVRRGLRVGDGTTGPHGTTLTRGGAMPRASYDGGRTWHPLPVQVGPLSTEEIRGQQVTAHTDLTVGGISGWHLNHVVVDEVAEWTGGWPYTTHEERLAYLNRHRLGGYPYVPRLHAPTIDD